MRSSAVCHYDTVSVLSAGTYRHYRGTTVVCQLLLSRPSSLLQVVQPPHGVVQAPRCRAGRGCLAHFIGSWVPSPRGRECFCISWRWHGRRRCGSQDDLGTNLHVVLSYVRAIHMNCRDFKMLITEPVQTKNVHVYFEVCVLLY